MPSTIGVRSDCRPTWLYVEDDPNELMLFKVACSKLPTRVQMQFVVDGNEAVAYLSGASPFSDRTLFPLPSLLLLDLKLPRRNGFEVIEWVRERPEFDSLPIVVLSSSRHAPDVEKASCLGANDFIRKSLTLEGLGTLVQQLHATYVSSANS